MMGIGYRIKEARESMGLTQTELGKLVGVTGSAITNYENNVSHPKEPVLYKLLKVLKVDANYLFQDEVPTRDNNSFSIDELNHIKKYRKLSNHGKSIVDIIIDAELKLQDQTQSQRTISVKHYSAPYYDLPVSAGTGEFLDSEYYTIAELTEEPPQGTNFIVRVSGDSMEPTYHNGDKLFVKQQQSVNIGEVGIFMIDGDVYVKELAEDCLISYNKKYKEIPFHEYNNIRCYGKVLGTCKENI